MQKRNEKKGEHMGTGFDRAMAEVAAQRELFWETRKRKLRRLPQGWREAIERGEELLRDAQRRKIESDVSFPLL
jgi:hypothetical protein